MDLRTPVVFIVFNRPELTRKSFSLLRQVRPQCLFLVADGPRSAVPEDVILCQKVRETIAEIDWPCEVHRFYATENLGCMQRITTGLNAVFALVPEAIIVEDDCLPDPTFFRYCEELLAWYRDDERVGAISGDNFQKPGRYTEGSYYFSRFPHCWGWATWRRAWSRLDVTMSRWPALRNSALLADQFPCSRDRQFWQTMFDNTASGKIDSWAFRWTLTCWAEGFLTALPSLNLVTNIGFGVGGTNNQKHDHRASVPSAAMSFPLSHPSSVCADIIADNYTQRTLFRRPAWQRWLDQWQGMFR